MFGRFVRHVRQQYAGFLALFIALGGVSYAAVTLPKNSIGSKQIAKGAVKAAELGKNAVNSAKVKDGSLLPQDFAAGTISGSSTTPGSAGPAGPAGDTGPAGPKGDKGDPCLSSDPACKGPKGDKGDPGPGSLAASATNSSAMALVSGCKNLTSLSITVPGPGKVLLEANASVGVSHTNGTPDKNVLMLGTSASDCSAFDGAGFSRVPASWPTSSDASSNVNSVSARRMVTVVAGGTLTYYLNNYGETSASSDDFMARMAMTATYFPN